MNFLSGYLTSLLTVYIACFVAFASPGPNFMAVSSSALESKMSGIGTAIGISVGTALWSLFAATGITALLQTVDRAAMYVSLLGGAYLCWLGFKSLRSVTTRATVTAAARTNRANTSFWRSIRAGLIIQLTNPKSALFWLAVTTMAIKPGTPSVVIAVLVLGCLAIAVVWHILLALAFAAGPVRKVYLSYKPAISLAFGLFFLAFGLRIIVGTLSKGICI